MALSALLANRRVILNLTGKLESNLNGKAVGFWNVYAVVQVFVNHAECNINLEIQPKASGFLCEDQWTRLPLNEKYFGL